MSCVPSGREQEWVATHGGSVTGIGAQTDQEGTLVTDQVPHSWSDASHMWDKYYFKYLYTYSIYLYY